MRRSALLSRVPSRRADRAPESTGDLIPPMVLLPPTRGQRRKAFAGRVLRAGAHVVSPTGETGPRGGAPARAVFASRLLTSHRSVWSVASMYSAASLYSACSAGSILSLGSAGSVLSIGSAGSILSIGSLGSILSIGSIGATGGTGTIGRQRDPAVDDRPLRRLATALAVASLLAALRPGPAAGGR